MLSRKLIIEGGSCSPAQGRDSTASLSGARKTSQTPTKPEKSPSMGLKSELALFKKHSYFLAFEGNAFPAPCMYVYSLWYPEGALGMIWIHIYRYEYILLTDLLSGTVPSSRLQGVKG